MILDLLIVPLVLPLCSPLSRFTLADLLDNDRGRGVANTVDIPDKGGVTCEEETGRGVVCPPVTAAAAALSARNCCDCIIKAICKADGDDPIDDEGYKFVYGDGIDAVVTG